MVTTKEVAHLRARVNELEGTMSMAKEEMIVNLREVDSLEKSIEVVRIDGNKTYQRALEAKVDTDLLWTRDSTLNIEVKNLHRYNNELF